MSTGIIIMNVAALGDIPKPETSDEWKARLLLPDSYTVQEAKEAAIVYRGDCYKITVESEDIPAPASIATVVEIVPHYDNVLNDDGTTYHAELSHIEICQRQADYCRERYEPITLAVGGPVPGIQGASHAPGNYIIDWQTRTLLP